MPNSQRSDHDILIGVEKDVGYIRDFIDDNKSSIAKNRKRIIALNKENQKRKDWQEDWDSKLKMITGIATFIGGIIVFIGNKIWELLMQK